MCSVFGFVSRNRSLPDLGVLRDIIHVNIWRGPHAFGLAWVDLAGRLHAYKQVGKMSDYLPVLGLVRNASMLIGHLRYVTQGDADQNINNHPHACDGGWLVHNGMVQNYKTLIRKRRLAAVSDCDSEAIALLIENARGSLVERCVSGAYDAIGGKTLLGLWPRPGRMAVVRQGNPLHYSDSVMGIYIGSLPAGMPGTVKEFRDNTARVLTLKGHHAQILTIPPVARDRSSGHNRREGLFGSGGKVAAYRGG